MNFYWSLTAAKVATTPQKLGETSNLTPAESSDPATESLKQHMVTYWHPPRATLTLSQWLMPDSINYYILTSA